ncbi:MAG: nucleoside recognition protein [Verrucomicrobiota bacterium]|nr:nucleoside recognition protein [Verrucomicrobiota bacterium]
MLNYIWLALTLGAVLLAGATGKMKLLTDGALDSAKASVTIALGLIGIMALWLGIMRLAEKSGFVLLLARAIRPLMRRLFPEVPPEHPAMGAMLMNIAANMLGLGNAATALGLRAMTDLEKLNKHPGTATNPMCTFLAINTSSVQLIPATAVAILSSAGSKNPTAIIGTALFATSCAAVAAVTSVRLLEKLPIFRVRAESLEPSAQNADETGAIEEAHPPAALRWWGAAIIVLFVGCFVSWFVIDAFYPGTFGRPVATDMGSSAAARIIGAVSVMAIPFFLAFFPLYAALRGVKVYEEFVVGAKEGFNVAVRIIPYLVAILVAVGMFRAAGGIEIISAALAPLFDRIGFSTELLPIVLVRPLSGSATTGLFAELVKTVGPDSIIARTAGTILGSTETTFYVLAVYFGSVAIRRTRHAVLAGLIADLTGVIVSVAICRVVFG